jgi:hypothetical protein
LAVIASPLYRVAIITPEGLQWQCFRRYVLGNRSPQTMHEYTLLDLYNMAAGYNGDYSQGRSMAIEMSQEWAQQQIDSLTPRRSPSCFPHNAMGYDFTR